MITCQFEDGGQAKLRHVVVDAIVVKDDKLLMVRRAESLIEGGKWAIVGGYMDRDETLVQTVAREVYEETGWEIDNIRLMSVIDAPDRPNEDRQNVSFVYFCTATKKSGKPDWESTEQRWYDFDSLPPAHEIAFDHTKSIDLYRRYKRDHLSLPILN